MQFIKLRKGILGLALLMMVSSTLFAGIEDTTPEQIKEREAHETSVAEELLAKGTIIHKQVIANGVIFTIERVYIDTYSYRMLCSIEKEDHTAFEDPEEINPVALSLTSMVESSRPSSYTSICSFCKLPDSSDKKIYFLASGSSLGKMSEEMRFDASILEINTTKVLDSPFSLEKFFKEVAESPKLEKNENLIEAIEELEEIKINKPELYETAKAEIDRLPKQILAKGQLNLKLISDKPNLTIDNIGFVDDQLNIRIIHQDSKPLEEYYSLNVLDKNNGRVKSLVWGESSATCIPEGAPVTTDAHFAKETYYIFPSISQKDLSNMSIQIQANKRKLIAEGPWTCDLKVPIDQKMVTKKVDQIIQYSLEKKAHLVEVGVSPLSIYVAFDKVKPEDAYGYYRVQLEMKDGKILDQFNKLSNHYSELGEQTFVYINEGTLFAIEDVASVIINGEKIQIQ